MTLKELIKLVTPSLFIKLAKWILSNRQKKFIEWEYIPDGWAYAKTHAEVKGWNVQDILEIYQRKWPRFEAMMQGTAPLGEAHESDLSSNTNIISHNINMSFAYAIALAAHRLESLSVLDWGGGIGHYYLLAKLLLPDVKIDYHCKDVPVLAEHGAQLFPEQHFWRDEACLERTYHLVLVSASLHYTEDWQSLLAGLARATQGYLYITRLPTVLQAPSFVFIQRPYDYGYNTEYLGWCLNRTSFFDEAIRLHLTLVREFVTGEHPLIANAPEPCEYRGFLFRSQK